jgi:glutamate transport system permease protein
VSDPALRVLFDAPGPRARRRIRLITVLTALLVAGLLVIAALRFAAAGQLAPDRWAEFTQWPYIRFLAVGLVQTLEATVVAGGIAFPLAMLLALGRLSSTKPIHWVCTAWIEFFRSIPLLLLVYVFVGGLPAIGINVPIFWKLVIPIFVCASAVIAEVLRAGILALPRGQSEAAFALGLTGPQTMRMVVLPQAIRLVVPSLVTQVISLLKDSTLGYAASYPELMKSATNLTAFTHHLIQTYLVVAAIYVVINLLLSLLARRLERGRRDRPGAGRAQRDLQTELAPNTV